MNRVVTLMSLLLAIITAYGQQGTQWYDVSNFAPSVRQCQISPTNDRLYVYVNTGDKDVNFWVEEPQRTGALMVLNGNDLMEYRQALFNEFITESLNSLPSNATVQPHVQQRTEEYEADITGVDLINNAGYNPLAMVSVLYKIGGNYVDIIQDHPSGDKRTMYLYNYILNKIFLDLILIHLI